MFKEETLENLGTPPDLTGSLPFRKFWKRFEISFPCMQLLEDAVPFVSGNVKKFKLTGGIWIECG